MWASHAVCSGVIGSVVFARRAARAKRGRSSSESRSRNRRTASSTPLLVEPYRRLSSSTARQLLEMECLVVSEVDFGVGCGEEADLVPVCLDEVWSELRQHKIRLLVEASKVVMAIGTKRHRSASGSGFASHSPPNYSGQSPVLGGIGGHSADSLTRLVRLVRREITWRPRRDSNSRTWFRKPMLYPLSYEGRINASAR